MKPDFVWFFFYLIEMRNLDKENKVLYLTTIITITYNTFQLRWLIDPRSKKRNEALKDIKIVQLDSQHEEEVLIAEPLKDEPILFNSDGTFACNVCGRIYKQIGYLHKHLASNHAANDLVNFRCQKCDKLFDTKKKLTRHEKNKTDCRK